jgi:predicted phage terminase large subunit-like protein
LHFKAIEHDAANLEFWHECAEIKNNRKTYNDLTGLEGAKKYYGDHKEQMDIGVKVLWPEMLSYFDLYMMRDDNPISFASEMMNEPVDSRTAIIPSEIMYFWNGDYASKEALLKFIDHDVSFIMACDPSMGKATTKGDYSAIIVLARDNKTKVCYVIEADIKRRPIDELIRDILSYASRYRLTKFVIETNGFQELVLKQLEGEAKKQNIYLPTKEVKTSTDKVGRVQGLYKYILNKQIQFDKNHILLMEQIATFPYNQHDDGVDCLQFGFEAAQQSGEITVWHSGMDKKSANDGWWDDYRRNLGWRF